MSEIVPNLLTVVTAILGVITAILGIVTAIHSQSRSSIKNQTKEYALIRSMVKDLAANPVVAHTGLKRYIGASIDDDLAEHVLTSRQFYELSRILKDVIYLVEFDKIDKTFRVNRRYKKIRIWPYVSAYFLFAAPVVGFVSFWKFLSESLQQSTFLGLVPFVIYSLFMMVLFAFDVRRRTRAIGLIESSNKAFQNSKVRGNSATNVQEEAKAASTHKKKKRNEKKDT